MARFTATTPALNETPAYITEALGDELETFTPSSNVEPISITDVKPIASYSWIDNATPTILVPGEPPAWVSQPTRVRADKGMRYIHESASRMGPHRSALEPVLAAIEVLDKKSQAQGHDFFTDRNALRKLLRWAHGQTDRAFRIDVALAGDTVVFSRMEEKNEENVPDFHGYGEEYVKAATRWPKGQEKATSHHRVTSMDFGGVKILLRHELDARVASDDDMDNLSSALSSLSTAQTNKSSGTRTSRNQKDADVSVIRDIKVQKTHNELPPQSSLLEIKTRAQHRELDWDEAFPQLFLSQTAWLYLAKHAKGFFGPVEKYPLNGIDLEPHARKAERAFSKLRDVLEDIQDAVKTHGEGRRLTLACINGNLALYELKKGKETVLPDDIFEWFTQ